MSAYQEAPSLPREPTLLRVNDPGEASRPSPSPAPEAEPERALEPEMPADAPRKPSRDLPPPPRFPSMQDVSADVWPDSHAVDSLNDVSWARSPDPHPPSSSASRTPPPATIAEPEAPADSADAAPKGVLARVMALFKKKKPPEPDASRAAQPPAKPPLVRAKEIICKFPDPTLLFVLQAAVILAIHAAKPHILRTWPARIITPLLLVPTVAATALWRRTRVISLKAKPDFISAAAPIPNAGKVVSMGESLRAREKALLKAEDELRKGQMRLEVLRKEIEGRLPPQVSIANLLEQENDARTHLPEDPVVAL